MKKSVALLFSALAFSAVFAAEGTPAMSTLAVTKVVAMPSVSKSAAESGTGRTFGRIIESLDANILSAIDSLRKFKTVSRKDLDAVLKEQSLAASGNVNTADPNAAQSGRLASAKYILTVTVDDFQDFKDTVNFAELKQRSDIRTIRVGAIVKVIDSTDGSILQTANVIAKTTSNLNTQHNVVQTGGSASDDKIALLVRDISTQIANRVADAVFPPKIVGKTGKIATFNRGGGTGVSVGDEYEVFALGEEMVDPDTGDKLGYEEVSVGRLKVVSVAPKFSRGTLTEDNGVEKGQVVRLVKKSVSAQASDDEI